MTGAKEFPGPGDSDGLATGSITLEGAVSWSMRYPNLEAPTAMDIHAGAAGRANPPLIDLGRRGPAERRVVDLELRGDGDHETGRKR